MDFALEFTSTIVQFDGKVFFSIFDSFVVCQIWYGIWIGNNKKPFAVFS